MALKLWSYTDFINLLVEGGYCDPERGTVMYRKGFGVIKTTGNIRTSPSPSISREVWDEPIMFIGTWLGASFITFQVEVKGGKS